MKNQRYLKTRVGRMPLLNYEMINDDQTPLCPKELYGESHQSWLNWFVWCEYY